MEIIEDQEGDRVVNQEGDRVVNINLFMRIGKDKAEELISYNQLIDYLEGANEHDNALDQECF